MALKNHPVEILKALQSMYPDDDWVSWDVEVLLHEVFPEDSDTPEVLDKVSAVQAVMSSPELPFYDSAALEKVTHAFCNNPCVVDMRQAPYIEELAYTLRQLWAIHPNMEVSGDVPEYVAAVGKYHNWVVLPTELTFAQEMLNNLNHVGDGARKTVVDVVLRILGDLRGENPEKLLTQFEEKEEYTFEEQLVLRILGAELYQPF